MASWTPERSRSRTATMALTETAPTDVNDGIDLNKVSAIEIVVRAPSALVSGVLLGYVLVNGVWAPVSESDYDLGLKAGLLTAPLAVYLVRSPRDRFMLVPNAVVLAGAGSTIDIDYWCTVGNSGWSA